MIKCHITVHKFSDSLFIVVVQRFVGATGSECDKIFPPFEFPECVFYYPPPFYDVFLIQHLFSLVVRREWCKNIACTKNESRKSFFFVWCTSKKSGLVNEAVFINTFCSPPTEIYVNFNFRILLWDDYLDSAYIGFRAKTVFLYLWNKN